jgi:hypothetical protein
MRILVGRLAIVAVCALATNCGGPSPQQQTPPPATTTAPAAAADDVDPADDAVQAPNVRSAAELAKLLQSNATGCAPGARCLRVTAQGRPSAAGGSIAQCRGEFPDFIVPRSTIPAGYAGPWFQPNLIETAHTGVPSGTRPWRNFDPRNVSERLAYLMALRNYAFASEPVRSLTPQLTADSDYFDSAGGSVPANQRSQKWYPAPRLIYGSPSAPGVREGARGMTLERPTGVNGLAGNTTPFRNFAVPYSDARGARTCARVWSTATPGVDAPDRSKMRFTAGGLVYKLLYSAARPTDFPTDILAGSQPTQILPNNGGAPVSLRLLQIDIAVKDDRAGPTGWYFATYAYDTSIPGNSPWLKMVPVGLMWGNDPGGLPLKESWINPAAPAYAKAHLGVDDRLNGPVDNPDSACMSCHSTAQAPSVANMVPPEGGPCGPLRPQWFRNLPGTQAFGRIDPEGSACETALDGITLTAADYSLQLASTVTRAGPSTQATFNPCTWDDANPPSAGPAPGPMMRAGGKPVRVFPVTRDPVAK